MENKQNSLELTAKETAFLSTMINPELYDSEDPMKDREYRCDPCDACGPSACADCKACVASYYL